MSATRARRPKGGGELPSKMMRRGTSPATLLVVGVSVALLAAGCGSSTTGISTGSARTASQVSTSASQTTTTATSASTASATSTTASTGPGGGTPAPSTGTHTAPEPEFTEGKPVPEGIAGARAVVEAHGYSVAEPAQYHESQALRVLIGSRTGDQEQAFFFVNSRYIGTDAKEASGDIRVIAQSDTEITLGYELYKPGNALCCPAGGLAKIRFQLNDGLLTTLDPLPPVHSSAGLSRQ